MPLYTLWKYRTIWMGVAALWTMLFHSGMVFSNPVAQYTVYLGYGGVDIFLFASGLGCYFSYTKSHDPMTFLKGRARRILPVFVPFMLLWDLLSVCLGEALPKKVLLGNLLGIEGFTGSGMEFSWYITALWVTYLLTPVFSGYIEKMENDRALLLLLAFLLVATVPFWNVPNTIILVTRLPVFVIGMYFAKLSQDREYRLTPPPAHFRGRFPGRHRPGSRCFLLPLLQPSAVESRYALVSLYPDHARALHFAFPWGRGYQPMGLGAVFALPSRNAGETLL